MPVEAPVYGFTHTRAFGELVFGPMVGMAVAPGETNRVFVLEKSGRILVITNLASPGAGVFLDLSSNLFTDPESGLLGLEFHPGFATNRQFFVFYTLNTTPVPGLGLYDRLSRFEVSIGDPNVALGASEVPLITQFDQDGGHNGGDLHFGPDGYLYVSLGDGGSANDLLNNSQQIDKDFFSGILRIDVDKRAGSLTPNPHPSVHPDTYAVPPDNPFVGATNFNGVVVNPNSVRSEFWAVGLRNPWRMSFDPLSGRLYCGDVGQSLKEEVNHIVKGGNYGWAYREGSVAGPKVSQTPVGFTAIDPILEYGQGNTIFDGRAVIGGVVYRGNRLSQLAGAYVFGDYGLPNIWSLRYDGTNATAFTYLTGGQNVSGFGTDPRNGDVLWVQMNGDIRRLTYNSTVSGSPLPATLADTGAFSDLALLTPQAGIVPYDLNVPFWSDQAQKTRWFSVPDTNQLLTFNPTGNWSFPTGTVWIKHFELELTNGVAASRKRLETRFIVKNAGGVYGVTYRWGSSTTNAVLVPEEGMNEPLVIHDAGGGIVRTQVWHYPGRAECLQCHTAVGGQALGFNTPQLNRNFDYGAGPENQLRALSDAGYFTAPVGDPATLLRMAAATNTAYSIEHRARSYLSANCVQCHQPGGAALGYWDARFVMPLSRAGIVSGTLNNNLGNPGNRVLKPGSTANSVILTRVATLGSIHMPPLATSEPNSEAVSLLSNWINSTAFVVGRHIFYNDSFYDGNNGSPNAADDGAIAPDKAALLSGQTAGFANYTSYSKGINGVMMDVARLAGTPTAADFSFRAGTNTNPDGWATAPSPSSITVRAGAGTDGADRITIIWPANAIQKQWLQVTVKATAATGLGGPDIFYFGNAVGECGNSATDARVNATDEISARNNPRSLGQAPIDFAYDYNRDGKVNATDEIIARNNYTSALTALKSITAPLTTTDSGVSADSSPAPLLGVSPLRIVSLSRATDGAVWIRFVGPIGRRYCLQATDDFTQPVWTQVLAEPAMSDQDGAYEFTIRETNLPTTRFFRIMAE
jgi:uncharacterized repeat protein (TIGR03806 family)